jgi:outer membrane beta-barrel protein
MTKKAQVMKRGIALLVGCLIGIPAVSQAAPERKSPLADAPAIRRRFELRDKRFEIGVGAAMTLNQDFYNALLLNVRLGFHITDWLGLSVSAGVFNLTPTWRTSFNNELNSRLANSCRDQNNIDNLADCKDLSKSRNITNDKTPTQSNAAAAENRIGQIILPQIDIVPFAGKFSLFSKLFMNYDFYISAGPGLVNLVRKGQVYGDSICTTMNDGKNTQGCSIPDNATPYVGMKLGAAAGVGMHAFANDFFAFNVELHDIFFKNNAAGRDVTGNPAVTSQDLQWTHNWLLGLNFMFFLPPSVRVSH